MSPAPSRRHDGHVLLQQYPSWSLREPESDTLTASERADYVQYQNLGVNATVATPRDETCLEFGDVQSTYFNVTFE